MNKFENYVMEAWLMTVSIMKYIISPTPQFFALITTPSYTVLTLATNEWRGNSKSLQHTKTVKSFLFLIKFHCKIESLLTRLTHNNKNIKRTTVLALTLIQIEF